MTIQQWSTTPATNASAVTNVNMATGSAPSTVHPSVRQMMADVATWYASPEWLAQNDTPTYVDATHFTVPTNRTATYSVGRRVQAIVTAGTIQGRITASTFSSSTSVTVAWDSGSLDSGLSLVYVGILQNQIAHMTLTGGTIDGVVIGGTTPAAGSFTTLSATGAISLTGDITLNPSSGVPLTITPAASTNALQMTTGTGYGATITDSTVTGFWEPSTTGTNSVAFGASSNHPLYLFTNNSDRAQITAAGAMQVNLDGGGTYYEVGLRDVPPNIVSTAYTLALSDRGKCVISAAAPANITIPANASVAFPVGTVINYINGGGGAHTISITSDTLIWTGGGSGTRTVAANGFVTLYKQQSTLWYITGAGIT